MHGGKAPQVKAAAQVRLAALVDPAIDRLEKVIKGDGNVAVAVRAARDVLDRTGFKPANKIKMETKKPSEEAVLLAEVCTLEELTDLRNRLTAAARKKSENVKTG